MLEEPGSEKGIMKSFILFFLFVSCCYGRSVEDDLLPVITMAESANRPHIISRDGGYGLCQIQKPTLEHYNKVHHAKLTTRDLLDGATNKKVARWYLSWLNGQLGKSGYKNDKARILCAYNWGLGNLKRNGYVVPAWFWRHKNKVYYAYLSTVK